MAVLIAPKFWAVQYTGSNGSEVDGFCDDWSFVSESGGVLTLNSLPSGNFTVTTGQWVVSTYGQCQIFANEAAWRAIYIDYATKADLGTATMPVTAIGVASVPTLLGATQTTVQVTIRPTLPSTSYSVASAVTGAVNLLASLSVLSTTVVSTSRVDVVVRNTGLLSLTGASVIVTAVMNA